MSSSTELPIGFGVLAELIVSAGGTAVLTIAYLVMVGRSLGPQEYADFGAALSIVYFAGLALSPLTPTVSRLCAVYVAQKNSSAVASLRHQVLVRLITFMSAPVLAIGALSVVIAKGLHFRSPVTILLSLGIVVLYAIVSVDRGVIHGFFQFRVHNVNTLLEASLRISGGAVLLLLFHRSAAVALVSYIGAIAIAELLLAERFRRMFSDRSRAAVNWEEVRRLTIPLAILMAAVATFQNADMLVVKRFFNAESSGAYAAATTLARGISVVFVPLYVLIGPLLARLHASGKPIFGATLRLTAAFLALSAVAVTILAVWPERIVTMLYGRSFAAAAPILAALAGVVVVTYTGLMLSQALITLGDLHFLFSYVVLAIVQIVVLLLFHATVWHVLACLYGVQGIALVLVAVFLVRARLRFSRTSV